jgi:hypothetical protein
MRTNFSNFRKLGRLKVVKIRVRHNKVIRNKKISGVKGYEMSHGKLKRMTTLEKRHRHRAAIKARIKIRSKKAQSLRKRKQSLRKRHAMGY